MTSKVVLDRLDGLESVVYDGYTPPVNGGGNGGGTPSLNAADYGVQADGVTDDTLAWTGVIAAANNLIAATGNGRTILAPRGTSVVSSTLLVDGIGVTIRGEGGYTSIIKAKTGFVGEAVIKFRQGIGALINPGHSLQDIQIDCNNQACHGVTAYKLYDYVYWRNVGIRNVASNQSAVRLIPDPSIANPISQTILWENVLGIHFAANATSPTFYLDTVHEATFIGCKAWGGNGSGASGGAPSWHLNNCRGINLVGCSSADSSGTGIKITTTDRASIGITITGHTFENVASMLDVDGADGTNTVQYLTLRSPRIEQTVGGITLDNVVVADLETRSQAVTIAASCSQVHVTTNDTTQVTNNGTNTSVHGWANAGTGGNVVSFYPGLATQSPSTPKMDWRVPGLTSHWSLEWSANSGGGDFGFLWRRYSSEASSIVILTMQATELRSHVDLSVDTIGKGLRVAEGTNGRQGVVTLSSGTATVTTTSVGAASRILLTAQDNNTTGALRVSARSAGTSFTITSSNGSDSGVVAYQIFEAVANPV